MTEGLLPPSIEDTKTRQIGVRNVNGRNLGGTRTEIQVRSFAPVVTDEPAHRGGTDTAPTPLEMVLSSLVGCKGATIHYIARAMGFDYRGVDFEGSSEVDMRGPRGVPGVRPFFERVALKICLHTNEPPERVARLVKNVEFRCPVMNLLRSADVKLDVEWTTVRVEQEKPISQTT
jgi:uncharacterized OsmC-like protein